jgi:AcrR family transcriptional regulator
MPQQHNSRQRKASDVREPEIIAAAAEAFRRKGYANASLQEIADSVGLLKGSLYYYIDSKEDLLFAVISELDERALEMLERIYKTDAPAIDRLAEAVDAQTRYNIANVDTLAVHYHDFDELSDERRKPIVAQRKRYERLMVKMIEEAQAAGDIDADLDAKMVSYFLLGAVNWLYTWYDPKGPLGPAELGHLFRSLVMVGLIGARPDLKAELTASKPPAATNE